MYIYWLYYMFFNIDFLIAAVKSFSGETLELTGVLRQEMGMYLCIASNTVPPTVSKRYSVDVHCKYHVALRPLISRRSVIVALHVLADQCAQTSSCCPLLSKLPNSVYSCILETGPKILILEKTKNIISTK